MIPAVCCGSEAELLFNILLFSGFYQALNNWAIETPVQWSAGIRYKNRLFEGKILMQKKGNV